VPCAVALPLRWFEQQRCSYSELCILENLHPHLLQPQPRSARFEIKQRKKSSFLAGIGEQRYWGCFIPHWFSATLQILLLRPLPCLQFLDEDSLPSLHSFIPCCLRCTAALSWRTRPLWMALTGAGMALLMCRLGVALLPKVLAPVSFTRQTLLFIYLWVSIYFFSLLKCSRDRQQSGKGGWERGGTGKGDTIWNTQNIQ